jgi:hypothetical protein
MVSVGAFCSTFCPSSVVTDTRPAAAFTHPAGTALSAYDSNVSFPRHRPHDTGACLAGQAADSRLDDASLLLRDRGRWSVRH